MKLSRYKLNIDIKIFKNILGGVTLKKILGNERGVTLGLTIIVFAVLVIFVTFLSGFMVSENKMSLQHKRKTQTYYVARSGAVAVEKAILDMDDEMVKKLNEELDAAPEKTIKVDNLDFEGKEAEVHLKRIGNELHIESKGTLEGVDDTVTMVLKLEEEEEEKVIPQSIVSPLDMSIYIEKDLKITDKNSHKHIHGKIIAPNAASITGITGSNPIREDGRNYPSLDTEKMKTLKSSIFKKNNSKNMTGTITTSTVFTEQNVLLNNSFTIDTTSGDVNIVVDQLKIEGKESLTIKGTNKVRIFVEKELTIKENIEINPGGKSNQLEIYYYGDQKLNLPNGDKNTTINANFYIQKADIQIGKLSTGLIYAPNSKVDLSDNSAAGEIYGIVAKTLDIGGKTDIRNAKDGALSKEFLLGVSGEGGETDGSINSTLQYKKGYFK